MLRSPYAHARIVSIDTSKALAHPNVAAVITAKDLETLGLAWMPTISYDTQAVLAGDKVRFQGQEVAFVIATDEYSANDALELIDVEYEPLPAVVNARKALDPDAPIIRDDKGQRDNLASPLWEAGDEEATNRAFAEADTVVTRDIIYPRCHPAPLETCGMIADFNPETGQLDIYNGNQAPHAHRTVYAHVAGLAEHMIRIICSDIGGGFGNKVPVYPGYVCAIAGSIAAGVPVKWVENRTENLVSTGFARDYVMRAEMCSKDGKITGLRVDVIADHGAFDSTAQPTKFPAGFFHIVCGSYDLQASHVKVKAVYTNKAPGGVAYRCSFRITEAVYLVERMVDALALEMEADPIELRMRSFIEPEQFPYETTTGWTYDSGNYAETMRVAMDIAGYEDLRREQAEKRARGELMGIGVSFFTEGVGAGPRKHMDILGLAMNDGADLRVHPSGKAVVSISAQPQGQGHETTFAQIVAEELGIPPEDVEVRHGDTDRSPYGLGTYGSRSTPVSGAAVAVVSRKVRDKARLIASTMLEANPDDLAWEKGRWYVKGDPEKGALIEDIAVRAYDGEPLPEGMEGGLDAQVIYDPPNLTYPYGAYIAVVDIDPDTAAGQGQALHRGRRLRRAHQPDGRRRPDPRRPRGGHRHRADGGAHVRRGGQLPQLVVHGLPHPDRARVSRLRARRDGHAVPAPPARREGRRRVAERRLAARDRERGHRRAAHDPRRRPHRHALHPRPRLGRDAGTGRAAAMTIGAVSTRAQELAAEGTAFVVATVVRAQRPTSVKAGDVALRARRRHDRGLRGRRVHPGERPRVLAAGARERGGAAAADPSRRIGPRGRSAPVGRPRTRKERRPSRTRACPAARSRSSSSRCSPRRASSSSATRRSRTRCGRSARSSGSTSSPSRAGAPSRRPAISRSSSRRTAATSCTSSAAASRPAFRTSPSWPVASAAPACSPDLRADGVPDEHLERIDVPAGIDIGAQTPAEIALSILATVIAVRRGKHTAAFDPARAPLVPDPPPGPAAPLAVDPICGMTVAAVASTPSLEHEGETVYFCCEGCRAAFEAQQSTPDSSVSPRGATGDAADEIRALVPDIETLAVRLADVDYLVDEGLATSMFLSLRLPQPLLLEGEAGVGKTEAAKALALVLDTPLVRLQCYEGIDAAEALYEWNYPRQLLSIRLADSSDTPLARGGALRPGVPDPPPAPARARAPRPAPGGAADRRDRPRRRRLRGVPARAARGRERHHPRARHDPRDASAGHRPDLEPDARPARRRQAPLPLPPDRVPDPGARGGDRAPARQGLVGDAGRPGRERRLAHALERRAEAAGDRRVDRLGRGADPARRRAAGRRDRGSHARLGAEVLRRPGGDPRGRPGAARARR